MKQVNQTSQGRDVYSVITNRIIGLLEQGVIPWKRTWTVSGLPKNLITDKPYRGINVWLLSALNYRHNFFLTFKQAKELGGSIRKGEKGHIVVFTKWVEREDPDTHEVSKKGLLRYYMVFNVAQCDGIPQEKIPVVTAPNNPMQECEAIVANMPQCPAIHFQSDQPYYNEQEDFINMPLIADFESSEEFYITLFHELIHSTKHQNRLDRKEVLKEGKLPSETYSFEELIAELGACYLISQTGLQPTNLGNSAAYIQSWLSKLKNDKRLIVYASAHAQRAVEFILDIVPVDLDKAEKEVVHE